MSTVTVDLAGLGISAIGESLEEFQRQRVACLAIARLLTSGMAVTWDDVAEIARWLYEEGD